jgi:cytoskeleton protein RodZ
MNAEVYAASAETVDIPVLPSVGNQLSAAREAKGLTVADVAQALKLGVRQVEALESGTWGGLPGATFIRGFVRNYARLVEIDPAPLMEQLEGTLDRSAPRLDRPRGPETPMPAASAGRRRDLAVVGFGLGLVGLALVSYFLLPSDLGSLGDEIRSLVFAGKTQESTASPAAPRLPGNEVNPDQPGPATAAAAPPATGGGLIVSSRLHPRARWKTHRR